MSFDPKPDKEIPFLAYAEWTTAWKEFCGHANACKRRGVPTYVPGVLKDGYTFQTSAILAVLAEQQINNLYNHGTKDHFEANKEFRQALNIVEKYIPPYLYFALALRPPLTKARVAASSDPDVTLAAAGVEANGTMRTDVIIDFSNPCPPVCPEIPAEEPDPEAEG